MIMINREKVKAENKVRPIPPLDAMFIQNGYNPFIIITYPNKEAYRYSGFDKTEFLMLERTFRSRPGKLANYLKSKSYVNCNHTQLTTIRNRQEQMDASLLSKTLEISKEKTSPIYQVEKDNSNDIH